MKNLAASIGALLIIATGAQASLSYSLSGTPTWGMPGWTTWALTIAESGGDWPVGFGVQIGDGVTTLGQWWPQGTKTVFRWEGALIPGPPYQDDVDTFFPFLAGAGPAQQVVAAPSCDESLTQLYGDFTLLGGCFNPLAGASIHLATVVVQDGTYVPFVATVVEYDPSTNTYSGTYPTSGIIPGPASVVLLLAGLPRVLRRRLPRV